MKSTKIILLKIASILLLTIFYCSNTVYSKENNRHNTFGLGASFGFVNYDDQTLASGTVITLRGLQHFSSNLSAEGNINFYKSSNNGKITTFKGAGLNLLYHFATIKSIDTSFYIIGGATALSEDMNLNAGIGSYIRINPSLKARIEAAGLKNTVATIGIEKEISKLKYDYRYTNKNYKPNKKHSKRKAYAKITHLDTTKSTEVFIQRKENKSHWAKESTWFISLLTAIKDSSNKNESIQYLYKKRDLVTRKEAAKMLTVASQFKEIIEQNSTIITYTIDSKKEEHTNTSIVIHKDGKRIRTLQKEKPTQSGTHTIKWNGYTGYGKKAMPGVYDIDVIITTKKGKLLSKKTIQTTVKNVSELSFGFENNKQDIIDIDNINKSFINYITTTDIIPAFPIHSKFVYNPNVFMSKGAFLAAIGTIIKNNNGEKGSLNQFKDISNVSKSQKMLIDYAVTTLNVSPDSKGKLNPLRMLTHHEAIILSARLYNWIDKQNK